jgi:hypothetical protein
MSVHNPHQFSPLWLFDSSKKWAPHGTRQNTKSGFASLNGGHAPKSRNFNTEQQAPIITDIPPNFKNKTSEFPILQSSKPRGAPPVNKGVWAAPPRTKGKLYPPTTKPAPIVTKPRSNSDAEKPHSPSVKTPKSAETSSKTDFFKSLRQDEGIFEQDTDTATFERESENQESVVNPVPLSSSVETEHRLLKVMGWSAEEPEQPLTDEEVKLALEDIETRRQAAGPNDQMSPPTLAPFPWAPKCFTFLNDDDLTSDNDSEDDW